MVAVPSPITKLNIVPPTAAELALVPGQFMLMALAPVLQPLSLVLALAQAFTIALESQPSTVLVLALLLQQPPAKLASLVYRAAAILFKLTSTQTLAMLA